MTVKRIPIRDVSDGEQYMIEGKPSDKLPKDNTLLIDADTGEVYDPNEDNTSLASLPNREMIQLPRTTWYTDDEEKEEGEHPSSTPHFLICPLCHTIFTPIESIIIPLLLSMN